MIVAAPGRAPGRSSIGALAALAGRHLAGAVLGALSLPAVLVALVAAPVSAAPALTVAGWERRRLSWVDRRPRAHLPHRSRLPRLLAARAALGLLTVGVLGLLGAGLVVAAGTLAGAVSGGPVAVFDAGPGQVTWATIGWFALPGLLLLFLSISGLGGIGWLDRHAWTALARPSADELERQVSRLNTTLADVVEAVDTERRRIERDLHDGVQQRVVALSILLARAERTTDPQEQQELRARATAETRAVLADLREVTWRIHPAMLDRDGLVTALESLRDRTPLPVRLDTPARERFGHATETAAYFVASEAITNVIKHAHATSIEVGLRRRADDVVLTVRDDGRGGADPTGPGLSGMAARVAARGGRLRVDSPAGGPSTVEAEIPCG